MHTCVYVCVCVRERQRESAHVSEKYMYGKHRRIDEFAMILVDWDIRSLLRGEVYAIF